jgi:hypothetical protein
MFIGGYSANGWPSIPLNVISDTEFTFTVPAGATGKAYVQVINRRTSPSPRAAAILTAASPSPCREPGRELATADQPTVWRAPRRRRPLNRPTRPSCGARRARQPCRAAAALDRVLDGLGVTREVRVVDGGSRESTPETAAALGARVLRRTARRRWPSAPRRRRRISTIGGGARASLRRSRLVRCRRRRRGAGDDLEDGGAVPPVEAR